MLHTHCNTCTGDAQGRTDGDDEITYTDETVSEFLRQRQERIANRRGRISEKLAKRHEGRSEGSIASSLDLLAGPEEEPKTRGSTAGADQGDGHQKLNESELKRSTHDPLDVQIDESRKQLEQIILDGDNLITNVRIAAESREKTRHEKFNESKKERCERLLKEAEESQQMYEDLKPNFDMTADHKLPMDLFEAIKSQMQQCEELLMKKQDLIDELQREVEDADFEFEQSLEMYQKDVSLIGDRIDDSMDELMAAFLSELNLIEDYTCRNREVILEENQREWMELLADFEEMEAQALEERKKDALNKFKLLNELYITTKQECRAQRHKFEDDFRILVQELEQVKYATQLNMEKLQYNLAILRKRYKENIEMKNMMKRLLLKFNDRFTEKSRALKRKMEAGKKEAKKILGDIAKLEESLDQFGKKTLHLAVTDWGKYMDLWSISEEMVRERLKKLLDSEKFIFETQLGIEAPMPDLDFMDQRPDVVTKHLMKKKAAYADLVNKHKSRTTPPEEKVTPKKSPTFSSEDYPEYAEERGLFDPCKSASIMLLPSDSVEFIPGPDPDPVIQRRLMKHLAKKICDESGLLVEEELRMLLEPFIETERNLVNLDAVLKALGINSVSDMQYLAHFMLRRCRVMKGVISRIGSQDSAHLSEMNVSLEGIIGKNAWEDWESGTQSSTKSKTSSPAGSVHITGEDSQATVYEECECDTKKSGDAKGASDPPKVMGETSVEVLHAAKSRTGVVQEDPTGICMLLPDLKETDAGQLDLDDFGHDALHCSPKCCGSEESSEGDLEVLVPMEDDGENEDEEEEEEVKGVASKCSTCGGEPHDHQDCSFVSSMATVLSWVDPQDPPLKAYKQALKKAEEGDEYEEEEEEDEGIIAIPDAVIENSKLAMEEQETSAVSETPRQSGPKEKRESEKSSGRLSKVRELSIADAEARPSNATERSGSVADASPRKSRPSDGQKAKKDSFGTSAEEAEEVVVEETEAREVQDYGEPVRMYSEIQPNLFQPVEPEQSSKKPTATPVSPEDEESVAETVSIPSLDSSSNGSEEFMYIDPDEVIDALTEFCKDYNAKITVEEPTQDEVIEKKLQKFKYPKHVYLLEYWERPARMLNAKSDDLWETMEYCFQHFNESLKKRNELVDQFIDLYKRNYELSYLLRNHLSSSTRRFLPTPSSDSMYRWSGQYC